MSDVDVVKRVYAAMAARDVSLLFDFFDPPFSPSRPPKLDDVAVCLEQGFDRHAR